MRQPRTRAGIIKKAAFLRWQIVSAEQDLRTLQAACPHTQVTKVAKSNTGNYDPSVDSYWYEFSCPDCGKWWTEDQ